MVAPVWSKSERDSSVRVPNMTRTYSVVVYRFICPRVCQRCSKRVRCWHLLTTNHHPARGKPAPTHHATGMRYATSFLTPSRLSMKPIALPVTLSTILATAALRCRDAFLVRWMPNPSWTAWAAATEAFLRSRVLTTKGFLGLCRTPSR